MFLLEVNLRPAQRVLYALQQFNGIGMTTATKMCHQSGIHKFCKVEEMNDAHLQKLRNLLIPHLEGLKQKKLERIKFLERLPKSILPK